MQIEPLDGRGPRYRQLYRALRSAILAGRAQPGSRLPSTRWLASEHGVARNRVVLAYAQLCDEGYAVARVGAGTYVIDELPATERAVAAPPRSVAVPAARWSRVGRALGSEGTRWLATAPSARYDFACGRPSFVDFPHSVWARLVRRRARAADGAALDYAPAAGLPELRAAIAHHLNRWRGVACTPEQVIVTNGSQQALGLIATLLVEPGEPVAIEEPHYTGARQALAAARATLVPVGVDADGLDVTVLDRLRPRPRLVYVTPAHQFPTGAVLPLGRRLALLAWAARAGAYVIEDDYDSEYRYAGAPIETLHGLDRAGRVFYVGSFSKILAPALRLGYLVVPPPLARGFALGKTAADLGSARFAQQLLADFIGEGHLEVHLRRSRRRHAGRRATLLAALAEHLGTKVSVLGADAGLHVLLVVTGAKAADVAGLVRRARTHGVGIYTTAACYLARARRAELMIGHGSLSEREIRDGVARLGPLLPPGRRRRAPQAER